MPRLSEIRRSVKVTGESQGLKQVADDLKRIGDQTEQVGAKAPKTTKATLSVQKAYERMQRSLDPTIRAMEQYDKVERTLQQARAQGLVSLERQSELLDLANERYMSQTPALNNAASATELSAFQMQNLSHQISDIGVSLASGQSPFMVLAQQGSQIAGAFGPGVGALGAVRALGTGLVTYLTNPLNLAVIGVAATAGAVSHLFSSIGGGAADADEAIEKHDRLVRDLKTAYGTAADALDDYAKKTQAVLDVEVVQGINRTQERLQAEIDKFLNSPELFGSPFGTGDLQLFPEFQPFEKEIERLRQEAKSAIPDMRAFWDSISQSALAEGATADVLDMVEALKRLGQESYDLYIQYQQATAGQTLPSQFQQTVDALNEEIEAGRRSELQNRILNEQREANILAGTEQAATIAELVTKLYQEEQARDALVKSQRDYDRVLQQANRERERAEMQIDRVIERLVFEGEQLRRTAAEQRLYNELRAADIDRSHEDANVIERQLVANAELARQTQETADQQRMLHDAVSATASAYASAIDTGNQHMDRMIQLLIEAIIQSEQLKTALNGLDFGGGAGGLFSALSHGLSGLVGGGLPGAMPPGGLPPAPGPLPEIPSAYGNVFHNGTLIPFARGGVVDRPIMFPLQRGMGLAGERGPEAIVPLMRDRHGRLGVGSTGGQQTTTINNNTTFHIHTPDVAGFKRSQGQIAAQMGRAVQRSTRRNS